MEKPLKRSVPAALILQKLLTVPMRLPRTAAPTAFRVSLRKAAEPAALPQPPGKSPPCRLTEKPALLCFRIPETEMSFMEWTTAPSAEDRSTRKTILCTIPPSGRRLQEGQKVREDNPGKPPAPRQRKRAAGRKTKSDPLRVPAEVFNSRSVIVYSICPLESLFRQKCAQRFQYSLLQGTDTLAQQVCPCPSICVFVPETFQSDTPTGAGALELCHTSLLSTPLEGCGHVTPAFCSLHLK